MPLHSSLVHLFLVLLTFAACRVCAAVVSDGDVAEKLEAEVSELLSLLEEDEAEENGGELVVEDVNEGGSGRREVLVPAGWRRFRRRISGAFRRIGGGIRRGLRRGWRGPALASRPLINADVSRYGGRTPPSTPSNSRLIVREERMLVCIHTLASLKGRGRVETEERVGKVLQHPLCPLEAVTAVSGGGGGGVVAEWSMR
ncbi:unnamed protein product [Hydatigera taeniaeformis]|uniref:Uncharacterized protein n=1 Tax=Hydatigena taeniaeformis TaxID=6205 RepID=A0A0R3XC13_HYDTA|nr:unnamed protein product [Hydatigera taeniaeformis]